MAETWRAVLASGEVREMSVDPCVARGMLAPVDGFRGWRADRVGDGPRFAAVEAMGDSAHEAIARLAAGNGWPAVEILAPGELTRAELRAQAWREGAEAMRRDAMRACSAIEDKRTEDAQWRRTHGSRATRDEDYHRLFGQAIGADACWDAIRAIPVPPCPEVPR